MDEGTPNNKKTEIEQIEEAAPIMSKIIANIERKKTLGSLGSTEDRKSLEDQIISDIDKLIENLGARNRPK